MDFIHIPSPVYTSKLISSKSTFLNAQKRPYVVSIEEYKVSPKYGFDNVEYLCEKSIDDIAKYADHMTKSACDTNKKWLIEEVKDVPERYKKDITSFMQECNHTSIGNMAYVALYCSNDDAKKIALMFIKDWRNYCKNKEKKCIVM